MQIAKKYFKPNLYFFYLLLLANCDRQADLRVEINTCQKQLFFESTDFSYIGYTTIKLVHKGFCYNSIDSISITKKYISGTNQIFMYDTIKIGFENIIFSNSTDESSTISLKFHERCDTASKISAKVVGIYKNNSTSNTLEFVYKFPGSKQLNLSMSTLLDTLNCETSTATGHRFLVNYEEREYCIQEINSIAGNCDFYLLDGYSCNSSDFSISGKRFIFQEKSTFF